MNFRIQDIFTYMLALVARAIAPALSKHLSRLASIFVSDVPRLEAKWVVKFANATASRNQNPTKIDATLQQFGRFIVGNGHVHGEPHDLFVYWGMIKRNAFYGSFRRKDSRILAGTGTFVLKISADSRHLTGHCSWYDNVLDDVWSSTYEWNRKG